MRSDIVFDVIPDELKESGICQCGCNQPIYHRGKYTKPTRFIRGHSAKAGLSKKNFIGNRYGKLVVIKRIENKGNNRRLFLECVCDCGQQCTFRSDVLTGGIAVSCSTCGRARQKQIVTNRNRFEVLINQLISSYRTGARSRGYIFDLSRQECIKLFLDNCHYCGSSPIATTKTSYKPTQSEMKYNGIDRIDSSIGYIAENVVTSCKHCNMAKSTMSYDKFIELCNRIASLHPVEVNHE